MALIALADGTLVHSSIFDQPLKRHAVATGQWADTWRKMDMQDVMIDLETGGTCPGCSIFSIGAVYFDQRTGELGDELYVIAKREGQVENGLHESESTMKWWADQSPEARVIFGHVDAVELSEALTSLHAFILGGPRRNVRVWGNGADFDNPIVAAACRALGRPLPWAPFNSRCYRTLKNLAPHIKLDKRQGTHHNALDDAKSQAQHLMDIVRDSNLTLA